MPANTVYVFTAPTVAGNIKVSTSSYTPGGSPPGFTFAFPPTYSAGAGNNFTIRIMSDGTMRDGSGALIPYDTEVMRIEYNDARNGTYFGGSNTGDTTYPLQWYGLFNGNQTYYMPSQTIFV
jgi:hypothetical protein